MAVVTLKSGPITNRDALPKVANNSVTDGGSVKAIAGTVEAANGDSIGSIYNFGTIPSNVRVHKVLLFCDAVTSGAADIGIYKSTIDGGAVVDADFFASAQSLAAGLNGTDVTHEGGDTCFGLAEIEMPLWQALGLSSDPCIHYDVCATLTAATTAAGTVALKVEYAY